VRNRWNRLLRILGPAGTRVTLTILDPRTGDTRDVTLERAKITVDNVTWEHLPGATIAHARDSGDAQLLRALELLVQPLDMQSP
jgi:hypothetical protein